MIIEVNKCPGCGSELKFDRMPQRNIKCPKCGMVAKSTEFQVVMKRKVYCPSCNGGLLISTSLTRPITCPKCKSVNAPSAMLDEPRKQNIPPVGSSMPPIPPVPGQSGDDGKTQINTNLDKYRPGSLELIDDAGCWLGVRQPVALRIGKNAIGRASQSSTADIQLPSSDCYMSKCHAVIVMQKLPSGEIRHLLSDNSSLNGTYLNGTRLSPGDEIVLKSGDEIRLGRTKLKFVLQ